MLDGLADPPRSLARLTKPSRRSWAASSSATAALILDAALILLPARVRELEDELAVVAVDALDERAPERNARVAVDEGVVGQDASAHVHRNVREMI